MASRVLALLRNEIAKALRCKLPYFGLFGAALICVLTFVVAEELSSANTNNAWGYVTLSMQIVFTDIGLIFILVFSALLMADETRSGTIRAMLAAPLHRWEFYAAKAAVGVLYMIVISVATLLLSMGLAGFHYPFSAISDSFGVIYSQGKVCGNFLLAFVLTWIPLGAIVLYGLFISTIVRSPGAAVAVSIGTLYIIDFTKHFVGLDPYIFTRYISYPWQILQQMSQGVDYQWHPEVWKMIGWSSLYGVAAFVAGLFIFLRQDLND
jgi:ABC-type transport system involved in multi-copper enzyme maturation permease subunit